MKNAATVVGLLLADKAVQFVKNILGVSTWGIHNKNNNAVNSAADRSVDTLQTRTSPVTNSV